MKKLLNLASDLNLEVHRGTLFRHLVQMKSFRSVIISRRETAINYSIIIYHMYDRQAGRLNSFIPLGWLGLLPFGKVVDNFDAEYEVI